jgi:hypothetical protein
VGLNELPDHPVGSKWLWADSNGYLDTLTVIKVTKRKVTMLFDNGETVEFLDKEKALRSGKLLKLGDCRLPLECGSHCILDTGHVGDCLCAGDKFGTGTCPA